MDSLTLRVRKTRAYHAKHPHLLQKHIASWASDFLRQKINQSISEILSDKFNHLDSAKLPRGHGGRERQRAGEHPLLSLSGTNTCKSHAFLLRSILYVLPHLNYGNGYLC